LDRDPRPNERSRPGLMLAPRLPSGKSGSCQAEYLEAVLAKMGDTMEGGKGKGSREWGSWVPQLKEPEGPLRAIWKLF
jgi:hypothetical protein